MAPGKKGTNPPREFTCELCNKPFIRKAYPGNPEPRFCNFQCRNTHNAQKHKPKPMTERKRMNQCKICGEWGDRKGDYCRIHGDSLWVNWTPENETFLEKYYSTNGAAWMAEKLGFTINQIHNKISASNRSGKSKLLLNKDIRQKLIYDISSKNMTENNPMHNPEIVEKVKEYWRNHPEEQAEHFAKFIEGHRRLQKDNPTKLEIALFSHLDALGIEHEPFYLVKPKFIVDAKCGNIIIQADGDYWHGHPRFFPFTERQLAQQRRDKAQDKYLKTCGYTVIRIWEKDMSLKVVANALNIH